MPKTNIVKKVRLSRGEQNARRSEELLEAAWTVFCDKGYESVTIDDVAAQAGYSRMPIYSLFGDKQSLFFALWQRTIDRMLAMLLNEMRDKVPLRRKLNRLADVLEQSSLTETAGAGARLFFVAQTIAQIGRASWRGRVGPYVEMSGGCVSL